jgi:hypothetical protein
MSGGYRQVHSVAARSCRNPPFFEDRNIFEMMIRRSFGEITLELTAEQFARLNR